MNKCVIFLVAICMLISISITVFASDTEILSAPAKNISEESKSEIANRLKLELVENDNYKTGISSFAVSETGCIAVAIENDRIYVYDANGVFQYGYYFNGDGACGVAFAGENVAIYFVRGAFYAIYDASGDCVAMKEFTAPDYGQISRFLNRTTIQRSGKTYTLERDVEFSGTYARLVITDEDGSRNIIYDISMQHSIGTVLMIAFIIGFFALAFWGVGKRVKEHDSREGIWYCRELKMQISLYDPKNAFFMDGGERIQCRCDLYISNGMMEVLCQELEHPRYSFGKTIFAGEVRRYEDMSMRVYDRKTWQEYTFYRTDKVENLQ